MFTSVDHLPYQSGWIIKTRDYCFPFLSELTVWSTMDHVSWPFELTLRANHHRDEIIYIQGPFEEIETPLLEKLVGSGMRLIHENNFHGFNVQCRWIELAYEKQDKEWRQRRYLLRFSNQYSFLLTAQSQIEKSKPVFDIATTIAKNFKVIII